MYNFQISKVYTFSLRAPAILGVLLKNAKLLSIFDYDTAIKYENIDLKYRQILPHLTAGTPDDAKSCVYYRFKSESGEEVVLADQWIDETTVDVITNIHIKIELDASLSDVSRIRDAMNALGYIGYTITTS